MYGMEELLTLNQLRIYIKYDGDDDAFLLAGKKSERAIINSDIWRRITMLIEKLFLVKSGTTSTNLEMKIRHEVNQNCDQPATVNAVLDRANAEYERFLLNERKIRLFKK